MSTNTRPELEIAGLSGELDTVMRGIVWHLMTLPGADGACLSTLDDEFAHFAVCAGEDAPLEGSTLRLAETLAEECSRREEVAVLRAPAGSEVDRCLTPGACAIVLAPVVYDGKVRGVLGVRSADPQAFDRADVDSIRVLTAGASIALRNAELVQRLAASERSYRDLHAKAADAALVVDVHGLILDANEAAAALLGYSLPELGALAADDLLADGEPLVKSGRGRADRLFRGKDGRELRLECSVRVLPDGRTHASLRDVTQRRRAEDRLRTNLGRLHAIVETQQEIAALELDVDAVTSAIVGRAEQLCGADGAAVHWFEDEDYVVTQATGIAAGSIGDRVGRTSSLAGLAALTGEVVHAPDTELDPRVDVSASRRIGARSAICAPLYRGGSAVGALSVVAARPGAFDELAVETTRMMAEFVGTLIRNADELEERRKLEAQLRQAQKMEAIGRLAGGISHDFNNLLTAIAGYSEFLIDGLRDDALRRHAEEIKKAAARAGALTGQLLAFSRRQVLQPRRLDLNAVVSDMDMMLRRLIGEDVELVTLLDPALAPVLADPTQIEQVIVNLAVNARDAMPQGGSVTIETANVSDGERDSVELRLTDTGVGMTEGERAQLFDPFFTTKAGGTGLGLATVYGVVQQSGGSIEVETAPGRGSSFRILLPAAHEAVGPVAPGEQESPQPGSETVLLVEDERIVRSLVAEILGTHGYRVLQAADGPSAVELLRRRAERVDLLVTDVVMPGMSGREVAQRVKALRPGTEVLYISGYTDSAIDQHGVLEHGTAFLQKPFSADELTRKVRAVLDGEPAQASTV